MLCLDDIKVEFESQGYKSTHMGISPNGTKSVLFMESTTQTSNIRCPKCDSPVHMHENTSLNIKDMPLIPGIAQSMFRLFVTSFLFFCNTSIVNLQNIS